MERLALIGAFMSLPLTMGQCTRQALENEQMMLDNQAKSEAIRGLAVRVAVLDSTLKVRDRQLARCRAKKKIKHVQDEQPNVGPEERQRSILGVLGHYAWKPIKLMGSLIGIG